MGSLATIGRMSACDIISKLENFGVSQVTRSIFLFLDPAGLKAARQVCQTWNRLVMTQIWHHPAKDVLERWVEKRWRKTNPQKTQYSLSMRITSVRADEMGIVCGGSRGQARVFSLPDGALKHDLQCNLPAVTRSDEVQVDLNRNTVATLTESSTVSLWCRNSGALLYQAKHHGELLEIYGFRLCDFGLLTGAGNGELVLVGEKRGVWCELQRVHGNSSEGIRDIDIDGTWMALGTKDKIQIWDLTESVLVETKREVKSRVWMIQLIYPIVFVVQGFDSEGVFMFNMETLVCIRQITKGMHPYHHIHTNGKFIILSEYNEMSLEDGRKRSAMVDVLNFDDLNDPKIKTEDLKKLTHDFSPYTIHAVATKTFLVVAHNKSVTLLNYWPDRILPSREFPPTQRIRSAEDSLEESSSEDEDEYEDEYEDESELEDESDED